MIEHLEYRSGQSEYYGQMWTWVSGESSVDNSLTGPQWSPIYYRSPNRRIEHRSPNKIIQLNKKN